MKPLGGFESEFEMAVSQGKGMSPHANPAKTHGVKKGKTSEKWVGV